MTFCGQVHCEFSKEQLTDLSSKVTTPHNTFEKQDNSDMHSCKMLKCDAHVKRGNNHNKAVCIAPQGRSFRGAR